MYPRSQVSLKDHWSSGLQKCDFVNVWISCFQSLRDIDYIVKDKTFLESVMDTEFYDQTQTERGVFYNGKLATFCEKYRPPALS